MTDFEYIAHFLEVAKDKQAINELEYRACMRVLDKYPDMNDPDTWVEF